MGRTRKVTLIQPESVGGNFEYVAIPRQGMLFLSGALRQWRGPFLYEREIWFEDRSGKIDPDKDLADTDILMMTALINETPRAYELGRLAKQYHPNLITIGGGPQMSPLSDAAIREGRFDIIVNREGEDIIGQLCDVLLTHKGAELDNALLKIPGISFMRDGKLVQTPRRGTIAPDFVELPDFHSIRDLTPEKPMAGGVLETVRGCTENCSYCQVIQQFLGYRMVARETEFKRLAQLRQLAEEGLIYTNREGRFSVFISDDLHPPPLRAVKFRNERLERLRGWKGHTDGMHMICQTRAEIGQDPELYSAMLDAGIQMLYVGVESSSAENLKAVRKRQDPTQVHQDLVALNRAGFAVVAMTIIGLPYDTQEAIMQMADWVKQVSKYQTANWLTPLPATSNWETLVPLDENGDVLRPGAIRPYHLYTGKQFVHKDPRWSMQESREIFDRYYARLNPVDRLYERVFHVLQRKGFSPLGGRRGLASTLSARVNQMVESLRAMADSTGNDLSGNLSQRIQQMSDSLRNLADSVGKELRGNAAAHIQQMSDSLRSLADSAAKEFEEVRRARLRQMSDALQALAESTRRQLLSPLARR
ncbi:MAG: radical SAM protein [Chloroflexi bacterium]|nr:radical SAM protein [Chloroflexota bacterium]